MQGQGSATERGPIDGAKCYDLPEMRDFLIFALIVIIAILGYRLFSNNAVLTDQQRQIHELNTKIEEKAKTISLELQQQCSKQAREEYAENGWKKEPIASYTNHYNTKMNKCFMLIESTTPTKPSDGTFFVTKLLFDAFEGKSYGEWEWQSDKAKKYWEVAPITCKGTLLSGEEKVCHSSGEFDEVVKLYMQ
jgi:cell division protein FtsL